MKYSGGLVKKEREDIFKLFLEKTRLKFSEIEKAIKIRSNMVSYHLEKMQEEGLLEKKDEYYYLTKKAERYLPIIPHITGKELSPLPIILIAVIHKNKVLLIRRKKRPYKDYWSLIGGKMQLEENFKDAALRVIHKKTRLDADFKGLSGVLLERVKGDDLIKHGFILFFGKAVVKDSDLKFSQYGELKWFDLKDIDDAGLIPSDLWLIQNKLNSEADVVSAEMSEKNGDLSDFKVL